MFQHQNLDYSKCQTYTPKNAKNILCVYFAFQTILIIFEKLLKGWELGWVELTYLPPCLDFSPKFDRIF